VRASGCFICSLSGDDCYEPERIKRQLGYLLAQPEQMAAVYSDMLIVDSEGRPADGSFLDLTLEGAPPPQGKIFARILSGNFLAGTCNDGPAECYRHRRRLRRESVL